MRIFGSTAYKNIPKVNRKKLDRKNDKMVFVGYEGESTNYRLWDEKSRKVHVSCDVTFNEENGKVTAEEESSEQKLITLDFGNYDEPIDEEEEESGADESSKDDVRECSSHLVKIMVKRKCNKPKDNCATEKHCVHLIVTVSSVMHR